MTMPITKEKPVLIAHYKGTDGKIIVRRPKEAELAAANGLFNEVKDKLKFYTDLVKKEEGKRFTVEKLRQLLKEDKNSVLIATDESGDMLGVNFNLYDPRSGTTWTEWTCVKKEHRNHGVGNALRQAMLKAAEERGFGLVVLAEVDPKNNTSAKGLEKLGFRLIATDVRRFWYSDEADIYAYQIKQPGRV